MKSKRITSFDKQKDLFFCDQGEFLGGAELFLLDIMPRVLSQNLRNFRGFLIGGVSTSYQKKLTKNINHIPYTYPPVRGNIIIKIFRIIQLAISSAIFTLKVHQYSKKRKRIFFTNTPRTHFQLFFAKKLFSIKGTWVIMIHDFTTPPFLIKLMAKTADILIANSLATRKFLHQHLEKTDHHKIKLVENGVDPKLSQKIQEKSSKNLDDKTQDIMIENILLLGRIDPKKGQIHFLQAADFLLERNPNLHFHIIGSPTKTDQRTIDYYKKCVKFKKSRKLTNVTIKPAVSNPLEVITKHDLLIALPTEPETFGRVIIEGLAMGKMVLSFNQTGPREILDHFLRYVEKKTGKDLRDHEDKNPLLIESNNAMDLAEKIGILSDHPEISQIFLPYAKGFIEENYSTKITEKAMLQVLENLN